jgi:hypothetical protein
MSTRKNHRPGAGVVLPPDTRIVVFHGNPKPHEISDTFVKQHWC